MAIQIPTATGPRVSSRALGAPQVRAQSVDNSASQLGRAALSAAGQVYQQSVDEADNAALIAAESQLSNWKLSAMFDPEKGVYSRKGQNALDITNQTLPQFDQQANQIAGALTNERQRARFNQIVASQRNALNGELNRYEFGERQRYYDQADDASLNSAMAGATAYYQDPQQVAYYQNKATRIIASNGQRKGLPQEAIAQNVQNFNSGVAASVVERMALDDPLRAQQYFAQASSYMTPDDQFKVSRVLGTAVRKQMGSEIGSSLWETGSLGDDALPALVIQAESSGDPTAVSPKGARGLMQLMPDTAREMAGELGIEYSEERLTSDPQYNMALGTAYLNKMLGRYNGDKALALAAYNAGPGSVDKWIKEIGDPRTGEITQQEFIDRIPFRETRDYTGRIVEQLQGGQPASRTYADATRQAQKIQDPELRKYALDRVDDLYKAQQLEMKASYEEAASIVLDRGFAAIPANVLAQIPATDQAKLMKLDDQRRKGIEPETDLNKLQEFISMPPAQLAELSLERDVRPYLNNSDFTRVVTAFQKAQQGDSSGQGSLRAEEAALEQVMAMAGIRTGKSKDALKTGNLEKQQQFRAAYQARKDAVFMATGKQPSLAESERIAQQLLLDVRLSNTGIFTARSRKLWEVMPEELSRAYLDRGDLKISDIPPAERLRIVNALRASGQPASEETIVAAYIENISGLGVTVR